MLADQIKLHHNFVSAYLPDPRDVLVYLPPGYGHDPARRYPVFYLHDGQNLVNPQDAFGGVAWGVDKTAQRLILAGAVEPLIIVGIYNSGVNRIDDYTPVRAPAGPVRGRGGRAGNYGRMIIDELKPFIEHHYLAKPGREFTGLGGSSLGGLVTLYLGLSRPDVFSRLAVMSPSLWWANGLIVREAAQLGHHLPLRIWLDIGNREGPRVKQQVRLLKEILLAKGWNRRVDLRYVEVPKAWHNEASWGARFDRVLKFLFPVRK